MPTEPRKREKLVCSVCGSDDILADAFAAWDAVSQSWVLHSTYDAAYCQNSDNCSAAHNGDESGTWIEIEGPFMLIWGSRSNDTSLADATRGDERFETYDLAEAVANLMRTASQGRLWVHVHEIEDPIRPSSDPIQDSELNKDQSQEEKPYQPYAGCGDLDAGSVNQFDPRKRGFTPK